MASRSEKQEEAQSQGQEQGQTTQTAAEANQQDLEANRAVNPVDLGTDVDKLPPVPNAGEFMSAEDSTEETSPTATPANDDQASKK